MRLFLLISILPALAFAQGLPCGDGPDLSLRATATRTQLVATCRLDGEGPQAGALLTAATWVDTAIQFQTVATASLDDPAPGLHRTLVRLSGKTAAPDDVGLPPAGTEFTAEYAFLNADGEVLATGRVDRVVVGGRDDEAPEARYAFNDGAVQLEGALSLRHTPRGGALRANSRYSARGDRGSWFEQAGTRGTHQRVHLRPLGDYPAELVIETLPRRVVLRANADPDTAATALARIPVRQGVVEGSAGLFAEGERGELTPTLVHFNVRDMVARGAIAAGDGPPVMDLRVRAANRGYLEGGVRIDVLRDGRVFRSSGAAFRTARPIRAHTYRVKNPGSHFLSFQVAGRRQEPQNCTIEIAAGATCRTEDGTRVRVREGGGETSLVISGAGVPLREAVVLAYEGTLSPVDNPDDIVRLESLPTSDWFVAQLTGADLPAEVAEDGVTLELRTLDWEGRSTGFASFRPEAGELVIDAVVLELE